MMTENFDAIILGAAGSAGGVSQCWNARTDRARKS
jgi:hypothetical protein